MVGVQDATVLVSMQLKHIPNYIKLDLYLYFSPECLGILKWSSMTSCFTQMPNSFGHSSTWEGLENTEMK